MYLNVNSVILVILLSFRFFISGILKRDVLWRRLNMELCILFLYLLCLQTLIIYFILLILLSACCGNLTPWAVYWGESYKRSDETVQPFTLARLLGLVRILIA